MTAKQPRVRTQANWLPQILTAASTVAATWGLMVHFMGPAVDVAVKHAVQAEFERQAKATKHIADSTNAALMKSFRADILCATQEITEQVGLIATNDGGKVTYSPRIVVQADTTGLAEVNAKVDNLTESLTKMWAFLRLQYTLPSPPTKGDKFGKPNKPK